MGGSSKSQTVGYRYYLGLSGNIDDFEGTVYCFTPMGTVHRDVEPAEMVDTIEV